jgi:hypothetical protein
VKPINKVAIDVNENNVWFLERYLSVFEFSELFPPDSLGTAETRGVPLIIHTDLGFDLITDIDRAKMQIRNRSVHHGWMRWTTGHSLQPGHRIILESLGEREYSIRLEKTTLHPAIAS